MKVKFRTRRKVRSCAKRLAQAAAKADAETAAQVLGVATELAGLQEISYEVSLLEEGVVATTRLESQRAHIRVSSSCTTVKHSVAHELGHILLNHSLVNPVCFEQDLSDCPPGFERLHLAMMPPAGTGSPGASPEGEYAALMAEYEAELFASELLTLLPATRESRRAGEWVYGLA